MKRIVCTLFCVVLFAAAAYGAEPVLSAWAEDSYARANTYGLLNWYCRDGDFTVPVTRAEFCDMVWKAVRAIRCGIEAEIDVCASEPFSDTDRASVFALAQLDIARGTGSGRFSPDAPLTREEAAVFMARAGAAMGFTWLPTEQAAFTDAGDVSQWAAEAVLEMQSSGLMQGDERGAFLPHSLLSREEAVAVLVRFLEKNGYNAGIFVPAEGAALTEADLAGLNGRYRAIDGGYEISYFQGKFASLVVTVRGGAVESALYTLLADGACVDLTREKTASLRPTAGRSFLGGSAYTEERDGCVSLELDGETVLTLPAGYTILGWQTMGKTRAAYAARDGKTEFFSLTDGEALFTLDGTAFCITNRYIVTQAWRYAAPTADAACAVYGVYMLEGECVEAPGLTDRELYEKGYLTDH